MSDSEKVPLLALDKKNNPYKEALKMFLDRLLWDLTYTSWQSRKRMLNLRDKYTGEKLVILCNGPSLLKTDFSLLQGVYTMGLNKINLLFNKVDFRPNFISSVNPLVIEQNKEFFNKTDIPLFFSHQASKKINTRKNTHFIHSCPQLKKFARDCSMSYYEGATVTFVALQLAFHMGFNKVALIGCDHNFNNKGPANKEVVSGKTDVDHFDPNYFAGGVKWQLPDLFQSEVSYQLAKDNFEYSGRQLINCTVGGELEIFPRMELEQFLNL